VKDFVAKVASLIFLALLMVLPGIFSLLFLSLAGEISNEEGGAK